MNIENLHPSGLTQERWDWPFKTETERLLVRSWLEGIPVSLLDDSIPF